MVIDQETYKLPETNYYSTEFKKRHHRIMEIVFPNLINT